MKNVVLTDKMRSKTLQYYQKFETRYLAIYRLYRNKLPKSKPHNQTSDKNFLEQYFRHFKDHCQYKEKIEKNCKSTA